MVGIKKPVWQDGPGSVCLVRDITYFLRETQREPPTTANNIENAVFHLIDGGNKVDGKNDRQEIMLFAAGIIIGYPGEE